MITRRFLGYVFVAALVCASPVARGEVIHLGESLLKKRVLSDLDSIRNIFEVKYAPLKWKQEWAGWNIDQAIEEAKDSVKSMSSPTLKECQGVIKDFFNSTHDYHVGVEFYSTESALLPFMIKGSNKRYFFCYVDRSQAPKKLFPFEVGDEILTFDSHPIHDVIGELREQEVGSNVLETDQALAELTLTYRQGEMGHYVPSGDVKITGKKKGTNQEISTTVRWIYTPERIRDFSQLDLNVDMSMCKQEWKEDWQTALKKSQFFEKFMVAHFWHKSFVGASLEMNRHTLGTRSSYIPPLGAKIWKPEFDTFFDAYIFRTPSGKEIGYIRIPHYDGDEEELDEFGLLMSIFQQYTDALVIDQINNPGGSIFYMYALASTLIDRPSHTPKHHLALTQEEVHTALCLLPLLHEVKDDDTAQELLGETVGGYPVDYEFVCLMEQFCQFLIDQWNRGNLYTESTFLFGVDQLKPHPYYRYNKPIVLLVNSLDFSGGDFFPAIMKDNQRATILGTRTAGAGGYVLPVSFPNHSGIRAFLLTGSLAERLNHEPIENMGIEPDIHYELSVRDLQENYTEYVEAIVTTVESLVENN